LNIYLHDRKLEITGQWTERQENSSTWQEVEGKRLNSPGKGRRSYGWNIYLHERKLGITGKWTKKTGKFLHVAGSGREKTKFPW
jgi:hypothetical protein